MFLLQTAQVKNINDANIDTYDDEYKYISK